MQPICFQIYLITRMKNKQEQNNFKAIKRGSSYKAYIKILLLILIFRTTLHLYASDMLNSSPMISFHFSTVSFCTGGVHNTKVPSLPIHQQHSQMCSTFNTGYYILISITNSILPQSQKMVIQSQLII